RARPLVVARAQVRVPDAGVARAVVDEIQLRVVRDPTPDRAAAQPPLLRRPAGDALIGPLILRIKRVELGADQDVLVGTGVVPAPDLLAGLDVERGDPAADAQLAARVADQRLVLDHHHGGGRGLAHVDVANLGAPDLLAGAGVHRHHRRVQQAVDDLSVRVGGAAVHDVAAGDALGARVRVRLVD